jgi:short-subunit dehydrogenase
MKNVALITGASSGIGRELAKIHAAAGGDLIVVARRIDALEELKQELENAHGVQVVCVQADLTEPGEVQRLYEQCRQTTDQINVLINNAGFGGHGKFHERNWDKESSMIALNITALTELTHLVVPGMIESGKGKILNVGSTAGFLPGPLQAVYYATKAYVNSFSQAIAEELSGTGVTVTVLCPGPVDTGFSNEANLDGVEAFQNAATPQKVAHIGYQAMQNGKLVVFDSWRFAFLLGWIVPLLPRKIVLALSRRSMEKS